MTCCLITQAEVVINGPMPSALTCGPREPTPFPPTGDCGTLPSELELLTPVKALSNIANKTTLDCQNRSVQWIPCLKSFRSRRCARGKTSCWRESQINQFFSPNTAVP